MADDDGTRDGEAKCTKDTMVASPKALVLQKVTGRKRARYDIAKHGQKTGEPSRNPRGHARGVTLSEAYKTALAMSPGDLAAMLRNPYKAPLNMAELIAAAITSEAAKGRITHAMELADRTEGKVAVRPNLGSELLGVLAEAYQDEAVASLPEADDEDAIFGRSSVPSDAVPVHN